MKHSTKRIRGKPAPVVVVPGAYATPDIVNNWSPTSGWAPAFNNSFGDPLYPPGDPTALDPTTGLQHYSLQRVSNVPTPFGSWSAQGNWVTGNVADTGSRFWFSRDGTAGGAMNLDLGSDRSLVVL